LADAPTMLGARDEIARSGAGGALVAVSSAR